jgi:hypothetical protein
LGKSFEATRDIAVFKPVRCAHPHKKLSWRRNLAGITVCAAFIVFGFGSCYDDFSLKEDGYEEAFT